MPPQGEFKAKGFEAATLVAPGSVDPLIALLEQEEKAEKWFGVAPRHFFRRVSRELAEALGGGAALGPRLQALVQDLERGMAEMPARAGGPPAIFAADVEAAAGTINGVVELLSSDDEA